MKTCLSFAAAAALTLPVVAAPAPASAQVLVLRSLGPSAAKYPAGARYGNNARFNLQAGDLVAILTPRGTRVFRDSGTYGANGPVPRTALSRVQVRAALGVVRGSGPDGPLPPDVWHRDVVEGGPFCLPAGGRPLLWRPDAARAQTLNIRDAGADDGAEHSLAWPAGRAVLAWPARLPVRADARYVLTVSGVAQPVQLIVKPLRVAARAPGRQLAAALLDAGCDSQLNYLIATRLER